MSRAEEMTQETETCLAGMLNVVGGGVGKHDNVCADGAVDRFGCGESGAEILDRRGLLDVESLAPRHLSSGVDQPDLWYPVAHGNCVRHRPAKRATADDRNETHPTRLF